jgi:hypothetical protein
MLSNDNYTQKDWNQELLSKINKCINEMEDNDAYIKTTPNLKELFNTIDNYDPFINKLNKHHAIYITCDKGLILDIGRVIKNVEHNLINIIKYK